MHSRHVFSALAALMLAGVAAAGATADATPGPVPGEAGMAYRFDTGTLEPWDGAVPAGGVHACGGEAPLDHYCATGEHDAATLFLHGFASPFPTAATLESRIIHADGMLMFRCHYANGQTQACQVLGPQPPTTGIVFHDCYAYLPYTAGLVPATPEPAAPTGVPGGVGPWECLLV